MSIKKNWIVEQMAWTDETTGRCPWGVTNIADSGYGYDTFDTRQEAFSYALEKNIEGNRDALMALAGEPTERAYPHPESNGFITWD